MATYPDTQKFHVYEHAGVVVMARVVGEAAALVTQASITSISYAVLDVNRNKEVTGSGPVAVATSVYDVVQTGNDWPFDDGYNFRFVLPAACFPRGGHEYRVEFLFTPSGVGEQVFPLVCDLGVKDLFSV